MDHLFRIVELYDGYPDTRVLICAYCMEVVEGHMEDAEVTVCAGVPGEVSVSVDAGIARRAAAVRARWERERERG